MEMKLGLSIQVIQVKLLQNLITVQTPHKGIFWYTITNKDKVLDSLSVGSLFSLSLPYRDRQKSTTIICYV